MFSKKHLAFVKINYFIFFCCVLIACKNEKKQSKVEKQFDLLPSNVTNIDFVNKLDPTLLPSPLEYINVFNGGGVILVDINNDDLTDILFTGNMVPNKLYLNKGNFKFEDITQAYARIYFL